MKSFIHGPDAGSVLSYSPHICGFFSLLRSPNEFLCDYTITVVE